MTEASERLEKLIDQLENFENHETGDLDIDDVKQDLNYIYSLLQEDAENTPPFAVGEYYSYTSFENELHILKIKNIMGDVVEAGFLNTKTGELVNTRIELDKKYITPATAEHAATYKRAEEFASKGRKLNEFIFGDEVEVHGKTKTVISTNGNFVILSDTTTLKDDPALKLITTFEDWMQEAEGKERGM